MSSEFPSHGMALTHILVVGDLARSVPFYRDVLGASVYREYGGTSCVLQFLDTWLLLVTGGGPTEDKPDVVFEPSADPSADRYSGQKIGRNRSVAIRQTMVSGRPTLM